MNESTAVQAKPTTEGTAKTIYILYLIAIVLGPLAIVGVIMAYMKRKEAPEWLQTHYQFQIRTFWIGGLFMLIGILLSLVLIGYLVLLFWLIWLIIRSVKGMNLLEQKEAHPNPTSWMFS